VRIFTSAKAMRAFCQDARREGRRIAFVPTMGFLHEGHLALMREGRRSADLLTASIFVNPTQFNDPRDLQNYPRDEEGDLKKCALAGCDAVFMPSVEEMYPKGEATTVRVSGLTEGLCGASRPGHFDGVATVVSKLFLIVMPDLAVFGEKDYQQLAVIRRMTGDLHFGIEIVGYPTVREPDGLAMSSRNARLDPDSRARATALSRALFSARKAVQGGERDAGVLIAEAKAQILQANPERIDYLEIVHADSLKPLTQLDAPAVMALAVFFGGVRLIDNLRLI